jgi:CheY-like chemotaxis protein
LDRVSDGRTCLNNLNSHVILVVDDNPLDTKLIIRAMSKARILNPVRSVNDGAKAIDYLSGVAPYNNRQENPLPVLILLDLKLPKRDGFEVLQWIRSQEILKRIPVIVLTSSAETPDINRAYDRGANSYLVKPVESDALVEMLKNVELYWLMTNVRPSLDQA